MKPNTTMGSQNIGRLLWQFSWPSIVGMLSNALYAVVDRVFVGQGVGSLAIAATTVAFPLMLIMMALAFLIGIGATALISIRLGEQKLEEAEKVAGNATTLLIILPICLAAIYLLFPVSILRAFGASPEVLPYALDFVHIVMLGSVFGALGMGMNNFIRAEGNPMRAMSTQVMGALINGVLNYIFIFKLGLGIKGSALATILGQLVATLWVLSYFLSNRSLVKLRPKNFKLQRSIVMSIMSIGFAPFAMQIANSVQQLILNKTVSSYGGDLGLSAVGILMSVITLSFMPIVGISQGAQPLIGFNYGARQFDRVKLTLKKAVIAASLVSTGSFLLFQLFPYQIVGLFSKGNTALTSLTAHAMVVYFGMAFIIGFQIICANYFQAVGKGAKATVLSLSRQVLLLIPLILILPHFWGIEGVWRTAPIADALSSLITGLFIYYEMKYLPEPLVLPELREQPD
ncbi:MAG: MATE family efflux transporter [Syntrophomonadaceae bacterium]